ncbi:MAG: substrate-binding domain-containing protein, partial [Anaerolineales bacterium]|nr:substrate-binding domain-containing protein [Anaerolineales bacterium]
FMAVGVLRELREAGLRTPEDVSVTGFDNIELSEYLYPALTTVNIPRQRIGRLIFHALVPADGGERLRMGRRSPGDGRRPTGPPCGPSHPAQARPFYNLLAHSSSHYNFQSGFICLDFLPSAIINRSRLYCYTPFYRI